MNFLKKIILISFSFFLAFTPVLVSANDYGLSTSANYDSNKRAFNVQGVGNDPGGFMATRIGKIIGAVLSFVGVIFMVLIVYGGLTWMTASGNEKQVEKAKNLIVQAVIGLVVVLAAYAITKFIGDSLTS
ncbi:MAG TPA: pilin [Patescibacteria group bacterium]|nr:pilin [Patescibacteria group bacterium]